jgi:hypothetical protein
MSLSCSLVTGSSIGIARERALETVRYVAAVAVMLRRTMYVNIAGIFVAGGGAIAFYRGGEPAWVIGILCAIAVGSALGFVSLVRLYRRVRPASGITRD